MYRAQSIEEDEFLLTILYSHNRDYVLAGLADEPKKHSLSPIRGSFAPKEKLAPYGIPKTFISEKQLIKAIN